MKKITTKIPNVLDELLILELPCDDNITNR